MTGNGLAPRGVAALLIASTLLVAALAASILPRNSIRVSEAELLPADPAALAGDRAIRERFGDDREIVIAVVPRDGVGPARFRALYEELASALARDPSLGLYFVDPVRRHRFSPATPDTSGPRRWMLDPPSPTWFEEAGTIEAVTSKWYATRSAKGVILHQPVPVTALESIALERVRGIVEPFERQHAKEIELHLSGRGLVQQALGQRVQRDLARFVPAVVVVTFLLLLLAFRSLSLALLAILEVGIAVTITLGALTAAGHEISLFTSLIPLFLTALGIADEIHLYAEFLALKARHPNRERAANVRDAVAAVARPITLTSVTTALAFLSFAATDIPGLRVFGFYAALGTLVSWALTLGFVPAVLIWLPVGSGPAWVRSAPPPARTRRRALAVLVAASVLVLPGLVWVELDDAWTNNFEEHDEIVRDVRWLERESTGLHAYDLMLEDLAEGWDNPGGLERIRRIQQRLDALPDTAATISLVDLLRERRWELDGTPAGRAEPPATRDAILQALHTFRVFNEQVFLNQLLSVDRACTRLVVFMVGDDYATASRLRGEIVATVATELGTEARYEIGGGAERSRVMIHSLARTQLRAVALSLVILFSALVLMTGSVRLSLRCMAVVCWGLLLVLGMVGWSGLPLGVASSCFLGIALGVGIDYAVHMAFGGAGAHGSGRAGGSIARRVACNVAVVGSGLAVMLLSTNPTIRTLGALLALSMVVSGFVAVAAFVEPAQEA